MKNKKIYIIAEMSANHMCNKEIAIKTIKKLQTQELMLSKFKHLSQKV